MTPEEIKEKCLEWDGTAEMFSKIVAEIFCSPNNWRSELASEYQVAETTVKRWGMGVSKPHPYLQQKIIQSIQRLVEKEIK